MNTPATRWIFALAFAAVVSTALGVAFAGGVPAQDALAWGGMITDDAGKPLTKAVDVKVAFYAQASGGTAKCQSATTQTDAKTGRFAVALPAACATAIHETVNLWSETTADGKTLPRVKVGAVPYALEAGAASTAGGPLKVALDGLEKDVSALQAAAGGNAAPSNSTVVDASGVKIGTLIFSPVQSIKSTVWMRTSAGYKIIIRVSGYTAAVRFVSEDCTGTPYANTAVGTYPDQRWPGDVLIPAKVGSKAVYYRVKTTKGEWATGEIGVKLNSVYMPDGTCKKVKMERQTAQLEVVSAAAAGLPDPIKYPLTFKWK